MWLYVDLRASTKKYMCWKEIGLHITKSMDSSVEMHLILTFFFRHNRVAKPLQDVGSQYTLTYTIYMCFTEFINHIYYVYVF